MLRSHVISRSQRLCGSPGRGTVLALTLGYCVVCSVGCAQGSDDAETAQTKADDTATDGGATTAEDDQAPRTDDVATDGSPDASTGSPELTDDPAPDDSTAVDTAVDPSPAQDTASGDDASAPEPSTADSATTAPLLDEKEVEEPASDPISSDTGELVIPWQPADEHELFYVALPDDEGMATGEATLDLLWGEQYPTTITVELSGGVFDLTYDGEATFETITSNAESVAATLTGPTRLELTVSALGSSRVVLEGAWQNPDDTTQSGPASLTIAVNVVELGGAEWDNCSPPVYVLSGYAPSFGRFSLYDVEGNLRRPVNVDAGRPVTATVRAGAEGTKLSTTAGIGALIVEGPEQVVSIDGPFGALSSYEVIGPDRIDGVEVDYFMCASWTRGISLDSETTAPFYSDADPGYIEVTPHATVGGRRICCVPERDLFELQALTETTCRLSTDTSCASSPAEALPVGATVDQAGECSLRVTVPEGNAGQGAVDELHLQVEQIR